MTGLYSLVLDVEVYADQHEENLSELLEEIAEFNAWATWADAEAAKLEEPARPAHILRLPQPWAAV